jgi:Tfp pilus assembly protein PilO
VSSVLSVNAGRADVLTALKNRKSIIGIAAAFAVVMIWLVGFFLPQGAKLNTIHSQTQQAQAAHAALEARLARLKTYSAESAVFIALEQRLNAALPSTADVYDYITSLSNAANATGMTLLSVGPSPAVAAGSVAAIPVALGTRGSYDQTLAFIKALYALPRLTIITSVSISGGGASSNRSTQLSETISIDILAQRGVLASPQATS